MSTVLATYNIKGGVGKTSAAVKLAYLAALEGARTLLWDLDPQGASTYLFRVNAKIKGGGRKLVRGRSDVDSPTARSGRRSARSWRQTTPRWAAPNRRSRPSASSSSAPARVRAARG